MRGGHGRGLCSRRVLRESIVQRFCLAARSAWGTGSFLSPTPLWWSSGKRCMFQGCSNSTFCHAQICPDYEHQLTLLGAVCGRAAQALASVGTKAVRPVGRVVEEGVPLVDIALVTLDGVVQVAATLGDEVGRDEVAAGGEDAEGVSGEKGKKSGGDDDARLDALLWHDGGIESEARRGLKSVAMRCKVAGAWKGFVGVTLTGAQRSGTARGQLTYLTC